MDEHDRIAPPRIDPTKTPFTETEAFRRYGFRTDPDQNSAEAFYTKALIQQQGFSGPPHIVSRRELDAYVAAGEIELFRGVTDARFAEQLRVGDFFVGRGGLLDGLYTAAGPNALAVARYYAGRGDGTVVRLSLKQGARVIDADELEAKARSDHGHGAERSEHRSLLYTELGLYAAYLGYDTVHIVEYPDIDQYVILNRTALRIQRENTR
ncbi:MAG: hypothetical protein ACRDJE_15955 [Dehalococcoidia bacterium]